MSVLKELNLYKYKILFRKITLDPLNLINYYKFSFKKVRFFNFEKFSKNQISSLALK
jgi:hypothetical protein